MSAIAINVYTFVHKPARKHLLLKNLQFVRVFSLVAPLCCTLVRMAYLYLTSW